jgi:hypothetical protein
MKLIKISDTVAVNPDSIDAIEVGKGSNKNLTIITIGGKSYSTTMPVRQLLSSIELASENKWDGFFAG